jgi:cytochrome b561
MTDISAQQATAPASSPVTYLPWAKMMHWIVACGIGLMFVSGVLMTQLGGGPLADWLFSAHKLLGVILLVLMVPRIIFRVTMSLAGRWPKAGGGKRAHDALYVLAVLVPLLGWAGISDYGARTVFMGIVIPSIWPEGAGFSDLLFVAHTYMAFALIAVVLIHIGLALNDYVSRGRKI